MKYITFLLLFLMTGRSFSAVELELNRVKLPDAIQLIYSEVFKRPFMIDPALANDDRLLTFKITPDVDERAFIERYFINMNIKIHVKNGVDYIAPFVPNTDLPRFNYTYTPKFRSVDYLADMLSGHMFNAGISGASQSYVNKTGDVLVYYGTKAEIQRIKQLLPTIDTITDEVIVNGYVFEVQTKQSDGSGLALATKILSDKWQIGIGKATGIDNFISFKSGSVQSVFELLKTDGRFHVVSSPRLRVKNGSKAAFSVGSEVPVLSTLSYEKDRPLQSVEYRSSGVIFNIEPRIRRDIIELAIQQQLSNFVKTDTGVNDSPTLIKRDITTEVSLNDGDIIVLGGLAEDKNSNASSGWSIFGSKTKEKSKTDIVVILQVKKVSR